MKEAEVRLYNEKAWDRLVAAADRWTVPVDGAAIAEARRGKVRIVLTPLRPVPGEWLGELSGRDVLCLAGSGGQQAPLLAAAGARVWVLDNSPAQLEQDRHVAAREGLTVRTVQGDMRDLSAFEDASFDLVVHPCSNCFVEAIRPVWREAFRVLRPGGALLSGFCKPVMFLFDPKLQAEGVLQLKYRAPYSDVASLSDEERRQYLDRGEPLCFGHSLEDQLGGQLDAGFLLAGLYEDAHLDEDPLSRFLPPFIATRAIKPA